MGRRPLLLLVAFAVIMAGCLGPNIASWGSDSGEYKVRWDGKVDSTVKVTSRMSGTTYEMNFTAQGCAEGGDTLQMGTTGVVSTKVRLSGWLVASQQFPEGVIGSSSTASQNIAPAALLIAIDSFSQARENTFETYPKLTIKEWVIPTAVTTMPALDSKTLEERTYAVVAMIPASENVLDGFIALDNWQQPIELVGYAVNPMNPTGALYAGAWNLNDECRATSVAAGGVTMVVTQINFDTGAISANGDASDEWSQGDIPFIGVYLYTLLVLVAGGGGAVFLFMVSTGLERRGAKLTAREMLTEAQVQMARLVRKEVKQARREGVDMDVGSMIGGDEEASSATSAATIDLEEFDVESVLSGVHEGQMAGRELAGGEAMMTDDAFDMGDQLQDDLSGGVVNLGESTERVGHTLAFDIDDILNPQAEEESDHGFLGGGGRGGSSAGSGRGPERSAEPRDSGAAPERKRMSGRPTSSSDRGRADEPQVRRRAVRKSRQEDSQQPEERRGPPQRRAQKDDKPSHSDDDDFSDFSL